MGRLAQLHGEAAGRRRRRRLTLPPSRPGARRTEGGRSSQWPNASPGATCTSRAALASHIPPLASNPSSAAGIGAGAVLASACGRDPHQPARGEREPGAPVGRDGDVARVEQVTGERDAGDVAGRVDVPDLVGAEAAADPDPAGHVRGEIVGVLLERDRRRAGGGDPQQSHAALVGQPHRSVGRARHVREARAVAACLRRPQSVLVAWPSGATCQKPSCASTGDHSVPSGPVANGAPNVSSASSLSISVTSPRASERRNSAPPTRYQALPSGPSAPSTLNSVVAVVRKRPSGWARPIAGPRADAVDEHPRAAVRADDQVPTRSRGGRGRPRRRTRAGRSPAPARPPQRDPPHRVTRMVKVSMSGCPPRRRRRR